MPQQYGRCWTALETCEWVVTLARIMELEQVDGKRCAVSAILKFE
jgi:hypothetical protein